MREKTPMTKLMLAAFAEMEGDSVGTAVTDGQVKVYAADSVEGLKTVLQGQVWRVA